MRGQIDLSGHRFGSGKPQARSSRKQRSAPLKRTGDYALLWRIVDGAVRDCFANHPEYLTAKGQRSAVISINKRVTGAVHSWAVNAARGRPERSDPGMAADRIETISTGSISAWLVERLRQVRRSGGAPKFLRGL